jgi:hypothetical protein
MWISTYELSNAEWAAILQHGKDVMSGKVSIITNGAEKEVHSGGNRVCRLPTHKATEAGHLGVDEVTLSADGSTFLVARSVADHPARGITWYGAYLAALVMNDFNQYAGKMDEANLSFNFETPNGSGGFIPVNGFHIPRFYEWEHAARSASSSQLYATGSSISGTRANYLDSAVGKPRPVNTYLPNAAIGAFNLAGNVSEWIFEANVATPGHGFTRGGGYDDPESDLQNDARKSRALNAFHPSTGIRLALVDNRAPAGPSHPPAHVLVKTGTPLSLTGGAVGAPPLRYQWYRNDRALTGQTSRTLTVPTATLADAGSYKLRIINALGSVTTNSSLVTVVDSPPSTIFVKVGGTASLTAKSRGSSSLVYRWRKDELPLESDRFSKGVTAANLRVTGPTIFSTGFYDCQVTGPGSSGTVLTTETRVVFAQRPVIALPSNTPAVAVGGSFTLEQNYSRREADIVFAPQRWRITGLPPGMTYDPATGTISGRATKPGVYLVKAVASNVAGSAPTLQFLIAVEAFPAGSIGQFVGQIAAGTAATDDLGGRMELSTTSTGGFTGSVWIHGVRYPISGSLNTDPLANAAAAPSAKSRATVNINRGATLPMMQLSIVLDPATNGLSGTLGPVIPPATTPTVASQVAITGWRNVWNSQNLASTRTGRKHIRLAIPEASLNDPAVPQGDGFASLTISPTGGTTFSGRLADGSLISFSSVLGPTGQVQLFQLPYGINGSLLGVLAVAENTGIVTGTARWYKRDLGPASSETNYKEGFGPLDLAATGRAYTAPVTGSIVVGFPNLADNARLTLSPLRLAASGTELEDSASSIFRINVDHSVSLPPAAATITFSELRISPSAGTFTGKVSLTDSLENVTREASFSGMFIPNGTAGQTGFGHGYLLLPHLPGTAADGQLSARVFIERTP